MCWNISIKLDNAKQVGEFIKSQNPEVVALQEVVRHFDDSVFQMYKSKQDIEQIIKKNYPYSFFGPLWITDAFRKNSKMHRNFNGFVEQGNEIMSKFPFVEATNEHFYKIYSYALDWTNWETEDHARAVQIVELNVNGKKLQVLNLHGIWTKDKKGDSRTIKECKYIISVAEGKQIPTIIVGDFNLLPDTKSIGLLNKKYRNLVTEFNVKTTRPKFKDNLETGNNVVDYIFVNSKIKVNDLKVVDTDISDHLPIILDFDIKK